MKRRKDYRLFKQLLEDFNIHKFYHFTDRANILSIVNNGGLFSRAECEARNIKILHPGGSDLSHSLDCKHNLQDYVRISFCKNHPMMYSALADRRIIDPVILEIDTDLLFIDENIFFDKNALRTDSIGGTDFEYFRKIHFSTTQCQSQFDVSDEERPYYQAEILIKRSIPIHYILNINNIIKTGISTHSNDCKLPKMNVSISNPTLLLFLINQTWLKDDEEIFEIIINKVISALKNLFLKYHDNRYEISIIGYGDNAYPLIKGNVVNRLSELFDNDLKLNYDIVCKTNENAYLHEGIKSITQILNIWVQNHMNSYPPTVVHISPYGYNGADHSILIEQTQNIKRLSTNIGNTVVFNIIPSLTYNESVLFPSCIDDVGKYKFGEMYFLMSSLLPTYTQKRLFLDKYISRIGLAFKIDAFKLDEVLRVIIP